MHVPTQSGYRELGLELVSLEENFSYMPKKPPMVGENKMTRQDPFKMFLEESLERQRNEMMDNFTQILRRLPTSDASTSSRSATPFKVQINFHIPIFEGQIDSDVVDKWLNLLEGYFFVHNFSDRENIIFALLKVVPHVKDWWETFCEKNETEGSTLFAVSPTWDSFKDVIKEQYYPVGSYDDLYTRWTTLRQERDQTVPEFTNVFHTLRTKMGIKYYERHLVLKYHRGLHRYIQTRNGFFGHLVLGRGLSICCQN
jgi:hypothetical protein